MIKNRRTFINDTHKNDFRTIRNIKAYKKKRPFFGSKCVKYQLSQYKRFKDSFRKYFVNRKIYHVFNWEIGVKDLWRCPKNKLFFIQLLKKKKANVLKVFLSLCRKQKFFLVNLRMSLFSNIEKKDNRAIYRELLPIHLKYSGRVAKSFYNIEEEKHKIAKLRISSFAIKSFTKYIKIVNSMSKRPFKQNIIYNLIINLSPTRLHTMIVESRYILLLKYRILLPYLSGNETYYNFEWIRLSPFSYRKRACLVYENPKSASSSNVILRDYWFKKNIFYLP